MIRSIAASRRPSWPPRPRSPSAQAWPTASRRSSSRPPTTGATSTCSTRSTQLKSEVQALRAQLEDMQQQNEQLKASNRSQYLDLDGRLNRLEGGGRSGPGAATAGRRQHRRRRRAAPTVQEPTAVGVRRCRFAVQDRRRARRLRGRLRCAQGRPLRGIGAAVPDLPATYPSGSYAPNALYWLGESYYVTQNYALAQEQFQTLLDRYPTHDKAPGALLKVGSGQYGLKQLDDAERTLAEVSSRYPGSDAARTADDRLRAIQIVRASAKIRAMNAVQTDAAAAAAGPAAHHRNLPVAAGRGARRRLADRVRAPDRLSAALPVLRHRLRLPRRRVVGHRRDPGRSRQARRAPRLRHRRRAAGAEALHRPAAALVRCRL